jgi:hypothetical protein
MSQPADSSPPPDWAIKQASASLQGGMSAPEVEQRLVAVGLTPQAAKVVLLRAQGQASDPPPMLEWAMEHVRASLRAGMSVPDIERGLVGRGLTPEIAEAVTTRVLGERVRGSLPDTPEQVRRRLLHRILSGVAACGCLVLGYWFGGRYSVGIALIWVFTSLAFIWFGDIPHVWDRFFRGRFSGGSPASGVEIRWLGWSILLLYFVYRLVLVLYKP